MAGKDNCVRLTCTAKKRTVAQPPQPEEALLPDTKKIRVALGELSNLPIPSQNQLSNFKKCESEIPFQNQLSNFKKCESENKEWEPENRKMLSPYVLEIYVYLHSMEVEPKRRPLSNYIEIMQTDINANMRAVLVDWLVEVAEEYNLICDTLYLAVSYIDRFLSSHAIKRGRLQLLGVSCMSIASKYEEISPPHVEDFCYISDNCYTIEEVVEMESDVLKFLNFDMGNPTIMTFLRRFLMDSLDSLKFQSVEFEFLSSYLAELSLLDYCCVQFLPSIVAASVLFLSRLTVLPKMHPWSLTLQWHSGYRPSQLKECILAIHELHTCKREGYFKAIREKYSQQKFKSVAKLCPPIHIPAIYFEDFKS